MSTTDEAIAKTIEKLSNIVDAHGAEAVALGGRVLQLNVAGNLIWPVFVTAIGAVLIWMTYRLSKRYPDLVEDDGLFVLALLLGIVGIISTAVGIIGFGLFALSPLNWAILFDARLALAAKILGLI